MYIATCNFDHGGELKFKKGDFVQCDSSTAELLLKKGLIAKHNAEGDAQAAKKAEADAKADAEAAERAQAKADEAARAKAGKGKKSGASMPYCTPSDVTSEFKKLTLNDSTVSTAKVTEWISQADAYIDGKIGLKYEVPITATEALKIVKQISIWLVAGRVKDVLETATGESSTEQVSRGDLAKMAKALIQEIIEGKLKLSGATLASSSDGVRSFAVDNAEEHTVKKGEDQW